MSIPAPRRGPRATGQGTDNAIPEVPLTSPPRPSPARASAARRTIDALSAGADVFEDFFEHVQIGLALADLTTRYIRVNTTYAALLGRAPEEFVGVPFSDIMHPDDELAVERQVALLQSGQERTITAEERHTTPEGRELWVLHGINLVKDETDQSSWFAVSAQDITERRRAENDLRELTATLTERAVRDPLTGLANRTLLEERLRGTLSRDARNGGTTGLLFLDLDGFKAVNDRHGHAVGDAVLRTVSSRLSAVVRPSDTVARLGGDEFVVLAEGTTQDGLDPLVARLRAAVAEPVRVGALTLKVGVSIGVASSTDGAADAAGLLAASDSAMYAAKRSARPSA